MARKTLKAVIETGEIVRLQKVVFEEKEGTFDYTQFLRVDIKVTEDSVISFETPKFKFHAILDSGVYSTESVGNDWFKSNGCSNDIKSLFLSKIKLGDKIKVKGRVNWIGEHESGSSLTMINYVKLLQIVETVDFAKPLEWQLDPEKLTTKSETVQFWNKNGIMITAQMKKEDAKQLIRDARAFVISDQAIGEIENSESEMEKDEGDWVKDAKESGWWDDLDSLAEYEKDVSHDALEATRHIKDEIENDLKKIRERIKELVLDQKMEDSEMARKNVAGVKEKKNIEQVEEVEIGNPPCFGGYIEGNEDCIECESVNNCQEEAKRILEDDSEELEDVETEDVKEDDEFDPYDLDLSGDDRLEVLKNLTLEQLIETSDYLGVDLEGINLKKKDAAVDVILEIDEFIDGEEDLIEGLDEEEDVEQEETPDDLETEPETEDDVDDPKDDQKVSELSDSEKVIVDSLGTFKGILDGQGELIETLEKENQKLKENQKKFSDYFDQFKSENETLRKEITSLKSDLSDLVKSTTGNIEALIDRISNSESEIEDLKTQKESKTESGVDIIGLLSKVRDDIDKVIGGSQAQTDDPKTEDQEVEEVQTPDPVEVPDEVQEPSEKEEVVEKSTDQEPEDKKVLNPEFGEIPQFFLDAVKSYPEEIELKYYKDRVSAKVKGKRKVLAIVIQRGRKKLIVLRQADKDYGSKLKYQSKPALVLDHEKTPESFLEYMEDLSS